MRVMSIRGGILLTFAYILIHSPILCHGEQDVVGPGNGNDDVNRKYHPDHPWLAIFKSTWNEVRNVSPLACIFIVLPVTLCFLFCACVMCICIKCCKSKQHHRRVPTTASSRTSSVIKSPDGQLDPIPLTGLVNHHKSQGFQPLRPVMGGHPTSTA